MSGFDLNWLNLREPLDLLARDQSLLRKAARFIQSKTGERVIDIASGTGSTFRAVAPLAPHARWRLIDHDEKLLHEAARRHSQDSNVTYQKADLNDLASLSLNAADLVSASALFDLCSTEFITSLADHLAESESGLYAALNYDGEIIFDAPHPDDEIIVQLFNQHQQSDKGFGLALGPKSGKVLAKLFINLGFKVDVAQSDWMIDEKAIELHRLFVEGLASAVTETGMMEHKKIMDWLEFRIGQIKTSRCRVGHVDVLALPRNLAI